MKKPKVNKNKHLTEDDLIMIGRSFGFTPEGTIEDIKTKASESEISIRETSITPESADSEKRTIKTVIATEKPARMWDYKRWEPVDEILLMSGCRLDGVRKNKLPLLDCHMRETARNVLGSVIDLKVVGDVLEGTEVFSILAGAEFQKSQEGHLDQRSVGYRVEAATYIEPGETALVNGKSFTAGAQALKVATSWLPMEESVVPIGADPAAGIRSLSGVKQTKIEDDENMDKETRKMLESLGMNPAATDDEARAFLAGLKKPEPVANVVPPIAAVNDDAKRELERRDAIAGVFKKFLDREGAREAMDKAIDEKMILVDAQRALVDILAGAKANKSLGIRVGKSEGENFRENVLAAFLVRAEHLVKEEKVNFLLDKETRERASQYRGFSQVDICREALERCNVSVRGMDRHEIVGRAFTHSSSDFPYILENTAKKILLAAFATAPGTWRKFCLVGSLSDFKAASRVKMSEAGLMDEVGEGMDYPEHTMGEGKETISLKSFGKIFGITRQAIINDDLSAFTRLPIAHSRAWARTINYLTYKKFMANAQMSDGIELFKPTHFNLDGSTVAVSSVDTAAAVLRSLRMLLMRQKDIDGVSLLNLRGKVVLVPPTLEHYFVQASSERGRADNNAAADIVRMGLEIVSDAELENTALTGNSTAATYMFASPMDAPVVEVAFLDGNESPRLETEEGFTSDGVKFKVSGDVGVANIDHRGAAKFLNGAS